MLKDPVIESAELAGIGAYRFLDARESTVFAAAHAPGAVRVPIEAWVAAAKADETSLDNVAHWEAVIAALGVDDDTLTVIYDDGRMTEAARVWFILQYFGAKAVILNGGWAAMAESNIPSSVTAATSPPRRFHARAGSGSVGVVDREGVRTELESGTKILDARSNAEFDGEDLRRNSRGGHLPGARLLSHTSLLDGLRLRPADELRSLLSDAGFHSGDHVVTHCDGGARAALAAVAAVRAGYTDVRAYYHSFADWARDESCPIVRD
ncbi:rhodanese-like domain-containing protein [Paraburkholderia sediminicola]|uniref:sulfurtransferase n=1 Tax=Paraburkholderia TaxID=1822464 RepID=UPI0038B7E4AE